MASPHGMDVETYRALGLDQPAPDSVNGCSNRDVLESTRVAGDEAYHPCSEALPDAAVPTGKVTSFRGWKASRLYPDTVRDLWVYRPASFDAARQARLLVCFDGAGYLYREGPVRVPQILDTLHASGEIEPTVAVFVNPGRPLDYVSENVAPMYDAASLQRSLEYDSVTPVCGRFLIEEILPFVTRESGVSFADDPAGRTLCGMSSGGICAFNAAWHFPDVFGRVISHCGSFTNIRGGHNYPYLVRRTPRKKLRVFLQSGAHDAATIFGCVALANQTMANALAYAGYDYRFEFGDGGHTLRHAGALFAETLRWLWSG